MNPIAISVITIVVVVAITYYAFSQQIPFVHQYTMHALVNNSVAVRTDSPVRIAGVEVGKVENVTAHGRSTEINFTLDSTALPIHRDATVRVRSRLFLEGGYYLDLFPGSPSAPKVGDGFTIPESQTATPVQFYNVLSTFDQAARTSLESELNTFNDAFSFRDSHGNPVAHPGAVGFKQLQPQLPPVLKDTAWINRGLKGTHDGDVRTLIASAATVTHTLAASSAQLTDLVTGLNRASSALAASDGALAQSVAGLDETLKVAPPALTAIDRSLPPLTKLSVALDPSLKIAGPILTSVTGTLRQIVSVVGTPLERSNLLTSVKTTFVSFPSLLTTLGTALVPTKPVTDCLRTHVTPTLQTIVPDGALTSGHPVWQDFVHFLPRIAGASQDFDANGAWVRYLASAGTTTLSLGTLPVIGQLLSTGVPSTSGGASSPIQGASPHWVGQLSADAYHPEVDCSTQRLPSFGTIGGKSDVVSVRRSPAAPSLTLHQLRRAIDRAAGRAKSGGAS
jgi:virulence factor Mce-like protein